MSRVGDNIRKIRENSGMSARGLAKKMGVSESFLLDVEAGRKVVNEDMIKRFSGILGKNVQDLGLDSFESAVLQEEKVLQPKSQVREAKPAPREVKAAGPKEANALWDQAFGSTLKSVPIYSPVCDKALGQRLYPVEDGRIQGIPWEKAVLLRQDSDDLVGYGIFRNSLLLGSPVKEIVQAGFYLIQFQGRNLLRRISLPGNAKALLLTKGERELSQSVALKDVKPLLQFSWVETALK